METDEPMTVKSSGDWQSMVKSESLPIKSNVSPLIKEEPTDTESTIVSGQFECERCADSFPCKKSFLGHMARHMKCLKQFNCLQCRWLYFNSKGALARHTKKCHSNVESMLGWDERFNVVSSTSDSAGIDGDVSEERPLELPDSNSIQGLNNSSLIPQVDEIVVVDEVGDVDMSGFSELIKRFLN